MTAVPSHRVAKEGVIADGLDTGIFVMGPTNGMALIESLPDVEGVIVDQEGKVIIESDSKEGVAELCDIGFGEFGFKVF